MLWIKWGLRRCRRMIMICWILFLQVLLVQIKEKSMLLPITIQNGITANMFGANSILMCCIIRMQDLLAAQRLLMSKVAFYLEEKKLFSLPVMISCMRLAVKKVLWRIFMNCEKFTKEVKKFRKPVIHLTDYHKEYIRSINTQFIRG